MHRPALLRLPTWRHLLAHTRGDDSFVTRCNDDATVRGDRGVEVRAASRRSQRRRAELQSPRRTRVSDGDFELTFGVRRSVSAHDRREQAWPPTWPEADKGLLLAARQRPVS